MKIPFLRRREQSPESLVTRRQTRGAASGWDGLGIGGDNTENDAPSPVVTAFSIIKLLSGVEGTLPRSVHAREDLKRVPVRTPETEFLWGRPNRDWRTAPKAWWMTVFAHLEGWGNAYLWRRKIGSRTVGLEFIHPSRVTPSLESGTEIGTRKRKVFKIKRGTGKPDEMASEDDIVHIFGVSFDGISGVAPVRAGLGSHDHAQLLEFWGRNFLLRGGRPAGMVSTDERLTDEDYEEWQDTWQEQASGVNNVGRTILMDRGATYTQLSIPPEEAQYLETRQYTREEILGIYAPGLPHHLVGWRSNTSNFGTGLEAQGRHLAAFVLMQRLELVADAIAIELLPPELELEFRLDRLMKSDPKILSETFLKMRNASVATREDWRSAMGLPPLDGIDDDILVPNNGKLVTLSGEVQFADAMTPEPQPEPSEEPPDDELDVEPEVGALSEGRCTNAECPSRRGGRPGRILATDLVGQSVKVRCPSCRQIIRVSASYAPRDSVDLADQAMDRLAGKMSS